MNARSENAAVPGRFGQDTAGNRGWETDEFEISGPYPPTVSVGRIQGP